jgi:hypothetical protein
MEKPRGVDGIGHVGFKASCARRVHREIKKNLATADVSRADRTVGQTGIADCKEMSLVVKGRPQVIRAEPLEAFFAP